MTPSLTEYDFVATFIKAAEALGLDGPREFDAYFTSGYVIKTPELLLLFTEAKDHEIGAWYVHWAEAHPDLSNTGMDMMREFLRHMPYYLPEIQFARSLKNKPFLKSYSTERLLRIVGTPWASEKRE